VAKEGAEQIHLPTQAVLEEALQPAQAVKKRVHNYGKYQAVVK